MPEERGRDVWLCGNPRPVLAAVAVAVVVTSCLVVVERLLRSGLPLVSLATIGVVAIGLASLAWVASLPRIERRGRFLRIRLSPLAPEDVPLEVVECFFFGVAPLGRSVEPCAGSGSDQPADDGDQSEPEHDHHEQHDDAWGRRATLIMRLAERSKEWRSRPSLAAWGAWRHGAIAFDGLWCAKLSPDVASDLTRRLVIARRSIAPTPSAGEPHEATP